jgi:uncharacterized protein (TIGR00251 family)
MPAATCFAGRSKLYRPQKAQNAQKETRPFASSVLFVPPVPTMNSCTLELKTIPNAPRDEIAGWLGDALKVKVHAPALEGRANDALLDFLAEKLGLHRRAVTLLRGDRSRHKVVRVEGLTLAGVKAALAPVT